MKRSTAQVTLLITLIGVTIIFAVWLAKGSANSQQPEPDSSQEALADGAGKSCGR